MSSSETCFVKTTFNFVWLFKVNQMFLVVFLCFSWAKRPNRGGKNSKAKKTRLFEYLSRRMNFRTAEHLTASLTDDQLKLIPHNVTNISRKFGKFCRKSSDTQVNKWDRNFVAKRFGNQTFLFAVKHNDMVRVDAEECGGSWSDSTHREDVFTNASGFGFGGEIRHHVIDGLTSEDAKEIVKLLRSKNTTFLECVVESADALEGVSSDFVVKLRTFLFRPPNIDVIAELFEVADEATRVSIIELAIVHKAHWKLLRAVLYNEIKCKEFGGLTTFCQYLFADGLAPIKKWLGDLVNTNVTRNLPSEHMFRLEFSKRIKNMTECLSNENKVFLYNFNAVLNAIHPQKAGRKRIQLLTKMLFVDGIVKTLATNETKRVELLESYITNTSFVQDSSGKQRPSAIVTEMERLADAKPQGKRKDSFEIDTSDQRIDYRMRALLALIRAKKGHLKEAFAHGNVYKHKYIAEKAFWLFLERRRK